MLRQAVSLEETELAEETRLMAARFGLRRPPRIVAAEGIWSPFLVGHFRPVIVFPALFVETFSEEEWRMALAHEMAHIRRHDLWLALIPLFSQTLFFFFPLIWRACREWGVAREATCDAAALRVTAASPLQYGQMLLKIAARDRRESSLVSLGVTASYLSMKQRLLMMRAAADCPSRSARFLLALFLLLGLLGAVPWRVRTAKSATVSPEARIAPVKREREAQIQEAILRSPAPYRLLPLGALNRYAHYATGINASGQVVGWADMEPQERSGAIPHAMLFAAGQWNDLGALQSHQHSLAFRINAAGQVIGQIGPLNSGQERAFLYSGGALRDLGTLGGSASLAAAINDAGQIAGRQTARPGHARRQVQRRQRHQQPGSDRGLVGTRARPLGSFPV